MGPRKAGDKIIPLYEFQCPSCGLQFQQMMRASSAERPQNCVSCGTSSNRVLSAPSFNFATSTSGMGPQNTGVSGLDHNSDRVIGRDSSVRWREVRKRVDRKRRIIAQTGASGFDLSRQVDGDYRVMASQEREAAETARNMHHEAVQRIQEHLEARKNSSQ